MGTIITVTSAAGLYDALAHAKGGETIQLASGSYGNLALNPYSGMNINFPSNVTITSADPLHPATLTGLALTNVSNLSINGIVCDYTFKPGDPIYASPFCVNGGANLSITNCTFDGDVASGSATAADNGFGTATALSIRNAANVTISGNEVSNFCRGITVNSSSNVGITGNDIHDIRMDGMELSQVQGLRIDSNHIHDFHTSPTSGDHCDMIQFWTSGTTAPSTDITISNNVLDIGNGDLTQSIFMRNELVDTGVAGTEMYYKNVTIQNNVITNGQLHGITVGETAGLKIQGNSVLHSDGAATGITDTEVNIPRINVAPNSTGVSITGNITASVTGWTSQPGWTINHNAFVQDQVIGAPGYYGDVFISSSLTAHDGIHQFLALPGAMIDLLGAGAAATRDYLPEGNALAALFQATEDTGGSVQTRVFDASLSLTNLGTLPPGAVCQWTFGDGTTATGLNVVHNFATGGHYDVKLTVVLPGGATDTVVGSVAVPDSNILTMGPDGLFRAYSYEDTTVLARTPYESAAGLQLGATGVSASIAHDLVADLLRARDFDISMRLDADTKTSVGEVFRLHGSIIASVSTTGALVIQASSSTGTNVTLTSSGVSMIDLKSHNIDVRLHNGDLQLWVDGKLSSHTAFAGTLATYSTFDLTFGNPWGQKNFYGDITGFNVRVGEVAIGGGKHILTLGTDGLFHSAVSQITTPVAPPVHAAFAASEVVVAGVHLGDVGVAASVAPSQLTDLIQAHGFDISMQVTADSAASTGAIFRMQDTLRTRVNTLGEVEVRAVGSDGVVHYLTSTGVHVTDLAAHAVDIRLDAGKLQLWVDSTLTTQTDFAGTLHSTTSNMNFGNAAAWSNFDGMLSTFDISVNGDAPDSTTAAFLAPSAWTAA